jgi:AraC-like DNA-binding protein
MQTHPVANVTSLKLNDRVFGIRAGHRREIDRCILYIIEHFSDDISLDDLASAADVSKFNLCRMFQRYFKVTPVKWVWLFRALLAKEFVAVAPSWQLTDIAFSCGFSSSAHFSRCFTSVHGISPSRFRRLRRVADVPSCDRTAFDALFTNNQPIVDVAMQHMSARLVALKQGQSAIFTQ